MTSLKYIQKYVKSERVSERLRGFLKEFNGLDWLVEAGQPFEFPNSIHVATFEEAVQKALSPDWIEYLTSSLYGLYDRLEAVFDDEVLENINVFYRMEFDHDHYPRECRTDITWATKGEIASCLLMEESEKHTRLFNVLWKIYFAGHFPCGLHETEDMFLVCIH